MGFIWINNDKHAMTWCCKHGPFADFSREVAVDFADFSRPLDLGEAELRSSLWICSPPLPGLVNIQKAIEHGHFKLIYTSKIGIFHSKHVSFPEGIGVVYRNMVGKEPSWLGVWLNPSTSIVKQLDVTRNDDFFPIRNKDFIHGFPWYETYL